MLYIQSLVVFGEYGSVCILRVRLIFELSRFSSRHGFSALTQQMFECLTKFLHSTNGVQNEWYIPFTNLLIFQANRNEFNISYQLSNEFRLHINTGVRIKLHGVLNHLPLGILEYVIEIRQH